LSRLDDAIGCLLKPRVGAWPRVQQPGFDVVATSGDDGLVEDGPKLVLGDTRHERVLHRAYPELGATQRAEDQVDLPRHLAGPRVVDRGGGVDNVVPGVDESDDRARGACLDTDPTGRAR